jgi:hypothetical protein
MSLSFDDFKELRIKPCHYCGNYIGDGGYGLDRKDSNLGYTLENIVPCCRECNITKMDKLSYEEMLNLIQFRNESKIAENMIGVCC